MALGAERWPRFIVRFIVVDEPVDSFFVVVAEPDVVARVRTEARALILLPPTWVLNVVRLDSPLIAMLGCRFFLMISARSSGSEATKRVRAP